MSRQDNGRIVAYCGLVCSECGALARGSCHGCHSDRPMFKNCPVKNCAIEHGYTTCAECTDFEDLRACKKLNNFISKLMGLVFRRNRIGNLYRIRDVGLDEFKRKS